MKSKSKNPRVDVVCEVVVLSAHSHEAKDKKRKEIVEEGEG